MSTLTGKDLNLVKPALTDDHKVTIGTDLPANFQKIDDEFSTHLAETVSKIVLITEPFDQLTKTTVNLGFKPKNIAIATTINSSKYFCQTFSDGINTSSHHSIVADSDHYISPSGIYLQYNSTNYLIGNVAFTATGIEITWNLTGTLTGASGIRRLIISAITHGEG